MMIVLCTAIRTDTCEKKSPPPRCAAGKGYGRRPDATLRRRAHSGAAYLRVRYHLSRSVRPCPCGTFRSTASPFVPKSRHEFWNGLAAKSKSSMECSEPGPALRRPTGGRRVGRRGEVDSRAAHIRVGGGHRGRADHAGGWHH